MVTAKPIYNCKGRITDAAWFAIRDMVMFEKMSHEEVAKRFHCSQSTVTRVIHEDKPPSERTRIRKKDENVIKRQKLLRALAAEEETITGERVNQAEQCPLSGNSPSSHLPTTWPARC